MTSDKDVVIPAARPNPSHVYTEPNWKALGQNPHVPDGSRSWETNTAKMEDRNKENGRKNNPKERWLWCKCRPIGFASSQDLGFSSQESNKNTSEVEIQPTLSSKPSGASSTRLKGRRGEEGARPREGDWGDRSVKYWGFIWIYVREFGISHDLSKPTSFQMGLPYTEVCMGLVNIRRPSGAWKA